MPLTRLQSADSVEAAARQSSAFDVRFKWALILVHSSAFSSVSLPAWRLVWLCCLRMLQVQQLGRTHRSNQVQPPKYLIVSSDISGEQRFASAVAKRLEQLGALTHGDRHASSASDALSSSNLQTRWSVRFRFNQTFTFVLTLILVQHPSSSPCTHPNHEAEHQPISSLALGPKPQLGREHVTQ